MIFTIIIVLSLGFVHGRVVWYELPNFYLRNGPSSPDFASALDFAIKNDPGLPPYDYSTLARNCTEKSRNIGTPMTVAEGAAVICYTGVNPIPTRLNYALRSFNDVLLRAWTPYLKFFHRGMAQIFPSQNRQLCRGNGFWIGSVVENNYYTLPLSYSSDPAVCKVNSEMPDPFDDCTIINLDSNSNINPGRYRYIEDEDEYIMLPGTVGQVTGILPQTLYRCRTIFVTEVDPGAVPLNAIVESLISPGPTASYTTNMTDLFNGSLNFTKVGQHDYFLHAYSSNDSSSNLRVRQTPVNKNDHSIRDILHKEMEQLITTIKMYPKNYTEYAVVDG